MACPSFSGPPAQTPPYGAPRAPQGIVPQAVPEPESVVPAAPGPHRWPLPAADRLGAPLSPVQHQHAAHDPFGLMLSERVPLISEPTRDNVQYLRTRQKERDTCRAFP